MSIVEVDRRHHGEIDLTIQKANVLHSLPEQTTKGIIRQLHPSPLNPHVSSRPFALRCHQIQGRRSVLIKDMYSVPLPNPDPRTRSHRNTSSTATLLLNLIRLLASLLFPLVPVLNRKGKRIMHDLKLGADTSLDRLDDALGALCLLVLVLVCADDVDDGREGQFLELVGVLLDDGDALFEPAERRVAKLVGARQVG